MKLSRLIKELTDIHNKYGDMQVYSCGYKITSPYVYRDGEDEYYVNMYRAD